MDTLKALVGAGCGVDGVVVAGSNPMMSAVDATLEKVLLLPVANAQGGGLAMPEGVNFVPKISSTVPFHIPSSSGASHTLMTTAPSASNHSLMARVWSESSITMPSYATMAPASYLGSAGPLLHAPMPSAYCQPSYQPVQHTMHGLMSQYPQTQHHTSALHPQMALDSEALEAEYARSMSRMPSSDSTAAHAKKIAEILQTHPHLQESELLAFMRELGDGTATIRDNVVDTPAAAVQSVRAADMPTADEIQHRVNTIEQLWKEALLLPEDRASAVAGMATGSAVDIEQLWREATAAATELHAAEGGMGSFRPRTAEEFLLQHTMGGHHNPLAEDLVEKAWADVTNDMLREFSESPQPLSVAPPTTAFELAPAASNTAYQQFLQASDGETAESRLEMINRLMELGTSFFDNGDFTNAIETFEAVLHAMPEHSDAWLQLGKCYAETDLDKPAIACFELSVKEDPYNLPALLALGVSYVNEGQTEKALHTLRDWVRHHPSLHGLEVVEDAYSDGSLLDNVMQLMLAAGSRIKDDTDIATVAGVVYNASHDYAAAAEEFNHALSSHPKDYSLWNKVRDMSCLISSKHDEYHTVYVQLGASFANSGDHLRALEAYNTSIEIKPGYLKAWMNIGLSLYKLKRSHEAATAFLRALRIAPNNAQLWSLLRITFGMMDRYDLVAKTEACNPEVFAAEFSV